MEKIILIIGIFYKIILIIFVEKRLTKLSEEFSNMSDNNIIEWLTSKQVLEWCEDLMFVKKYIEKGEARK